MTDATLGSVQPEIVIRPEANNGSTCVELRLEERSISRLWLVPFTLRIGAATVRMDGIGGVGTEEEYRNRGYSRRVLEAAIAHMERGDTVLSMLYGIRDFYPKFGFATAGPDHLVFLTDLKRDRDLPSDWTVRPFVAEDLPTVQALYERNTASAVGAAVRPGEGGRWARLLQTTENSDKDACRVVVGPEGEVHGYLWRARWHWYVHHVLEKNHTDAMALGEVMADGPVAADAVLAACRLWAVEEAAQQEVKQVVLAFPPEGPLSAAAMRQDARFVRNFSACGGSMARVISVNRLLQALLPELQVRIRAGSLRFFCKLVLQTEIGSVALHIEPNDIEVEEDGEMEPGALQVRLPQYELARLALGAFPPGDLLARLPEPPPAEALDLMEILFPLRYPHLYLPDRY